MKKNYIVPNIEIVKYDSEELLAASGILGDEMGFGGKDDEGDLEPQSKIHGSHLDVWE
ncbi:MAG: hypothetical protein IKK92_03665 [Prevotella sp.]|nr:hypothetical protein [Prevotella sp.]